MTRFYSISIFKICCLQRQYLKSNQLINKSKKRPQPIDWYCRISIWPKFVGSPPRVREKPAGKVGSVFKSGITPACAGKTDSQPWEWWLLWDHPRVCGKNFFTTREVSLGLGSPPRVREKLVHNLPRIPSVGITPACAGKTLTTICINYSV